jgi:diguanylate cyclase (GGDEF)-like protein/PAS domain S-box-containing protein
MAEAGPPDASWFVQMARGSQIIYFVMRVQPDIAYEYVSDAIYDAMGITAAEILADPDTLHGQLSEDSAETLATALSTGPGREVAVELKWFHRNGLPVYSRCWAQTRQRDDGSVILEGTVNVITELRRTQTELLRSEERHRLLAENAWDVVWTMAMDGTITYVSPAVQRVRGITPEEASRQTLEEIHPPESQARVTDYFQRVFAAISAGTEPPVFRGEMEYRRKDGSIMTGELQVIPHVDADGQVVELLGVTRDISERKMFEAELTRLAATDQVTGVWNRHHGRELLETETATSNVAGMPMSVLMVDIDDFKSINDRFGHQAGDEVLVEVARRLRAAVRQSDAVARWGGEEFVILLRNCALDDAVSRAEKIRGQISDTTFPRVGTVTASIGAAELTGAEDVASLLSRADTALYEAKRSGRNTVVGAERG